MSSIVTAVPSGPIQEWCIQTPWFGGFNVTPQQCANATRGTTESDFETICCDGSIVDIRKSLFGAGGGPFDLADLVCCRINGPQTGGLLPLPSGPATQCSAGTPVPLASLAATNTRNAQGYLVTYTSASFGSGTTGDFVPTQTPYCLWAYTASGVAMTNVTVPAAQITTLSSSSLVVGTVTIGSGRATSTTRSSSSSAAGRSSSTSTAASLGSRVVLTNLCFLAMLFGAAAISPRYL